MKLMRNLLFSLLMFPFLAPLTYAQNFSTYRDFSFGMSLVELESRVDSQDLQAKLIQTRPSVLQEVTWWPWGSEGSAVQGEGLWQVHFRFHNGQLYRMLAIYDRHATRGLTSEDMIEAISTQYGPATRPNIEISFPTNGSYRSTEKVIAQWDDSQYSHTLFRSSLSGAFGLVMVSKRLDEQAELAITESAKLEGQEGPQKEIARQKKETNDWEVARQKNKKAFRP